MITLPMKVAIITRTKNRPLLLKRAVESVLGQSYDDYIHVIINDGGSQSDVDELIKKYDAKYKKRLKVIHNKTSMGMEAASNKAIASVKSDLIVIHDDDDSWHSSFLERSVSFLSSCSGYPNFAGVVCYYEKIWEKVTKTSVKEVSRELNIADFEDFTLWKLCSGNIFPPISFIYKRDAYEKCGMYREELPVLGDWDFNLRFMSQFEIAVIPEVLAYYHHRVAEGDSKYGNTVVQNADLHLYYNRLLRNEYLRKDIESGKNGLGVLMNLALQNKINREIAFSIAEASQQALSIGSHASDKISNAISQNDNLQNILKSVLDSVINSVMAQQASVKHIESLLDNLKNHVDDKFQTHDPVHRIKRIIKK